MNYMYKTVEDFESSVGYNVNDAFKDGFRMARLTMKPSSGELVDETPEELRKAVKDVDAFKKFLQSQATD